MAVRLAVFQLYIRHIVRYCDPLYVQLNHMKCFNIIMWAVLCILCILCPTFDSCIATCLRHMMTQHLTNRRLPPGILQNDPKTQNKQFFFRFPAPARACSVYFSCFFCITYRANAWFIVVLMELQFRGVLPPSGLAAQGPGNNNHLITPPGPSSSDFRNSTSLPRPVTGYDFSSRNSEPCEMEKIPPMSTGKRRGGSRKACNECKQQKVSQRKHTTFTCP